MQSRKSLGSESSKSLLNLAKKPEELFCLHLGVLCSDVGSYVQSSEHRYEIKMSDGESMVRMITELVETPSGGEICFKIDSDFYNTTKTSIDASMEKLE